MTNNEKFRAIFDQYAVSRPKFAKLVGLSKNAIDSYLAPVGTVTHRAMPDRTLEYIKLKLGAK